MPKKIISLRMDPDLLHRFDEAVVARGFAHFAEPGLRGGNHKGQDIGRTAALTHLAEAFVEGRCVILPRSSANPFPAEEIEAGSIPEFPLRICKGG